jgi:hypothetical protein
MLVTYQFLGSRQGNLMNLKLTHISTSQNNVCGQRVIHIMCMDEKWFIPTCGTGYGCKGLCLCSVISSRLLVTGNGLATPSLGWTWYHGKNFFAHNEIQAASYAMLSGCGCPIKKRLVTKSASKLWLCTRWLWTIHMLLSIVQAHECQDYSQYASVD